jgi:hypothetical protein
MADADALNVIRPIRTTRYPHPFSMQESRGGSSGCTGAPGDRFALLAVEDRETGVPRERRADPQRVDDADEVELRVVITDAPGRGSPPRRRSRVATGSSRRCRSTT